jgi:hypothetical protein
MKRSSDPRKAKRMNIQIVRLNSGEEILADVEVKDDSVIVKKPSLILPTGQGSIGLMPWMPYTDVPDGIEIKNSFVAFTVKPHDELINEYNTAFGNGLVIPPKQSISGPALTLTE